MMNAFLKKNFHMIRKSLSVFLALALLIPVSFGTLLPFASADSLPSVVVTTFPLYDWVRQIAGDTVNLTLLLDSGVDLHSYQPTVEDMMKIASCDLMVYIGGESDDWVDDALSVTGHDGLQTLNLMEALGQQALEEETVEGMEEAEEEEEEEGALDEHIWLSLRNAKVLLPAISDALTSLAPENSAEYAQRLAAYLEDLDALDAEYSAIVADAPFRTLLFGDRFPFRYLTADYSLSYYAAFSGCSAETEASFDTIVFLAQKLEELRLPAVLTLEGTDHRIAETIIQNTSEKNQTILVMNSLQGATLKDADQGLTYLSVMEANGQVLRQALYGE